MVHMSRFQPNKEHVRHALLFLFIKKKNERESRCMLVETFVDNALTQYIRLTENNYINIDRITESFRKEVNAVHFLRSEGYRAA